MMHLLRVLPLHDHHCVRSLLRSLQHLVAAFLVWSAQPMVACGAEEAADGGKSYGLPWLAIVLIVALGVFITLRPSGRAGEIKRDLRGDL